MAVCDAAITTEGDEYTNPLIVESSVGEEASMDEAIDEVLLEMLDIVEFVLSATESAATMDGSLLAAALEAEDDTATSIMGTAPPLEEA